MKITDKAILNELKKVRSDELEERIAEYPEDERDDKSDIEIFCDEVYDLLDLYIQPDTMHNADLCWARKVMKETKRGKVMPLDMRNLRPKYTKFDVDMASKITNEVKRLKACTRRLGIA